MEKTEKFLNHVFLIKKWYGNILQRWKILAMLLLIQIQVTNPLFFGNKAWMSFLDFSLFVTNPLFLRKM